MTLRADILAMVKQSDKPLTLAQLFQQSGEPQYRYHMFRAEVTAMAYQGQLERTDAPKGSGRGCKNVYSSGRVPV